MSQEGQSFDKKSLRALGDSKTLREIVKDCVAFANAVGGLIRIGVEDDDTVPPPEQRVSDSEPGRLEKMIAQQARNVGVLARKQVAENGGEYIDLQILRNAQSLASTSDGKYYVRVADESRPLMPDELMRLMSDKPAYVWEAQVRRVAVESCDEGKLARFLESIRTSDRVSPFVKQKSTVELLEHYFMAHEGHLTNLGVLWVGRRQDRALLQFAPVVQVIKYDERGQKVNKWLWDEFSLNPQELIEAVWYEVPEWRESYELPDGMFRTSLAHYDEVVVRELLANALVHRPYTQRGDIFLNLHPDRLEIHNPGLLPLGVTPRNILHTTVKRNEHLAKVFYDLKLMEREGSGYDRMYEVLLSSGRRAPEVREGDDRVTVTVWKRILQPEIVDFMFKVDQTFQPAQKEVIALGILAQHEALTGDQWAQALGLRSAAELGPWTDRLKSWKLVRSRGRTKATMYYVDPAVLKELQFKGRTSLKRIEDHRLKALILSDLEIYREASRGEIHRRIGTEIPLKRLRGALEALVVEGRLTTVGKLRWTRYLWPEGR